MTNIGRINIGPPPVDEYATGWDYRAASDIWLGYQLAFTPNERVPNDLILRGIVDSHACRYHPRAAFAPGYSDAYDPVYQGYALGHYHDTYAADYED